MQPASNKIQPIDSLTPFLGGKWYIRARVTDKTDVRTWSKPNSTGKLFSFTLLDESAAIRATIFNDAVDTFEPLLVNGQVYYFSGGQVKNANRRFSNVNNDYELTFDRNSEIMPAKDQFADRVPTQRFDFSPIQILKQREVNSLVDVLGVVLHVDPVSSITQRSTGRELLKRNVKIADGTAAVDVTFWNDEAREWSHDVGTVVSLRQVKIGSFDGVSLSSTFQTKVEANPDTVAAVKKLSDWFVSTGGRDVESLSGQGMRGSMGPSENNKGRMYLEEITKDGVGRGMKPDYVDVRCTPIYMKQDAQWYDACPNCNKKVMPEGAQGDRYRCEKCDTLVEPQQRYLISIQVTDNVSQVWLTLFNEAGEEFFGMKAAELKRKAEEDPMYITKLTNGRMNRPVLMRLRVKEESNANPMTGEETDRLRMSVVRITEFMPIAGTTEESRLALAKNLRAECDEIIHCIESYA